MKVTIKVYQPVGSPLRALALITSTSSCPLVISRLSLTSACSPANQSNIIKNISLISNTFIDFNSKNVFHGNLYYAAVLVI